MKRFKDYVKNESCASEPVCEAQSLYCTGANCKHDKDGCPKYKNYKANPKAVSIDECGGSSSGCGSSSSC